jgi:F420-dependent oxidoreductase-like protein
MDVGVHLVNFGAPDGPAAIAPTLARAAEAVERSGVANVSVMDHYLQIAGMGLGDVDAPMLEGYTTLGFLAAHTRTVELQLLVTGVMYRHPGLLAKIVATLDVLSGGRAVLGLGAGWYEREHAAYGVPFPPLAERFERLEETLQIARQMWSGQDKPYQGRHYNLARTLNAPQADPPILIGGSGEKKTLRLVAQYADACNFLHGADVRHKLGVLRAHCERLGRPYEDIEKTLHMRIPEGESVEQSVRRCAELAALGIDHVIVAVPDPAADSWQAHLAELAARISTITPAERHI